MPEAISPRIYVGAGGSGRRMVALLKQAVLADPNLDPDGRRAFQFLAVDADEYQDDCAPLDRHTEYVHIGGFRPSLARQADFMKEPVSDWWFDSYAPPYIQQGAGAVRVIGRLCYFYHYPRVRDAFQQAVQRATSYAAGRQVAGEVTVYVIASLAGGTGSSMLLDLGFMARKACSYRQVYVNAVLLLPDVFTVTQVMSEQSFKDRWMANGYAALKELVYFNENPVEFMPLYRRSSGREEPVDHPRLFDQCFFIEPVLGNSSTVSSDGDVFALAARSLYLFSASAHGSRTGSVLVNTPGVHYASLGMQAIQYPREHVLRYARHRATARWLRQNLGAGPAAAEDQGAREQLAGDLQADGWARLGDPVARYVGQLPPLGQVELDPEGDLPAQVVQASDRYRAELGRLEQQLAAWGAGQVQAAAARLEARLSAQLAEGRSLGWCLAYLRALAAHLAEQVQHLEGQARDLDRAMAREEERLRRLRAPGPLAALFGPRAPRRAAELETQLAQLYTAGGPRQVAAAGALNLGRALLTQWVQPRLHRFDQVRAWAEGEAGRQEEQAARVARDLDEEQQAAPHTQFLLAGRDLERLAAAAGAPAAAAGLRAVWQWVWAQGTADRLPDLLGRVEAAVAGECAQALDQSLLDAWELVAGRDELRQRFQAAALGCRPCWSYVEEQAREHMTRVAVLAVPPGAAWAEWLKDLRLDLKEIRGDPDRIVFLTVEGCRHLRDVHLKELPEWFRTYEHVQRAYEWGEDERPLHVHRLWQALPEVDGTLLPNPGRLFGPAQVRGLMTKGLDGYTLRLPEVHDENGTLPAQEVRLGGDLKKAMRHLATLPEPAAWALWTLMEQRDREALKGGCKEACEPFTRFAEQLRREGQLDEARRALMLQTQLYAGVLRRKKAGMAPGAELFAQLAG